MGDGFDVDGADAGVVAVELEGKLVVPVEDAEFAGFEFYFVFGIAVDLGVADVGVEGAGDGVVSGGGDFFEHEAAAFSADGGDGGLGSAEDDGDADLPSGMGMEKKRACRWCRIFR